MRNPQDVDDVDVREHLQRRTLPKGSSEDALWRLVAELHAERQTPPPHKTAVDESTRSTGCPRAASRTT